MAADDGEVWGAGARADPREAHRLAGVQPGARGGNREEAVGLREGRHRAGPLGQRNGDRSVPPMGEGGHHEFHAPEFGGDAPGQHSFDALFLARGKPGQRADQGHDEFVEGEYRRGREAGQDDDGLALSLGEAEGLAGLERDAVDEDTRLAQAGEDAVGHVARPLRRPSRQDDDVALRKRRADGAFESGLIVRDDAEGHGFAAILGDRSGDDGAVRIVNAGCRQGSGPVATTRRRWRARRPSAGAPSRPHRGRRRPACRSRAR